MKKNNISRIATLMMAIILSSAGCTKLLNVEPASQYGSTFLSTKSGVNAVLNSAYANGQMINDEGVNRIYVEESATDVFVNYRGFLNGNLQYIMDFTWGTSHTYLVNFWKNNYSAIRDANIVLEAIPGHPELTAAEKSEFEGQARFIRGTAYAFLYGWYGPVPIVQSPLDDIFPAKATEDEMKTFIISDLTKAAELLSTKTSQYGRGTKGAALGILAEFYNNTKQWSLAASTAKQVMDLGLYKLWPDFTTLFALVNENNSEMIYVFPAIAVEPYGNVWVANALPPLYNTPIQNTATQVCVPVNFYKTFTAGDRRRDLIIANYIDKNGKFVDLTTGVEYQNPRSLKYPLDPNAQNRSGGADFPILRYADILLIRAEGLVMSAGTVAPEALGLLNQIRNRAGLASLTSNDLPNQETFITQLLKERSWEFYSEGKRRQDLLRHDLLITNALARGKSAKPYHVRFPIPQTDIDANKNLIQNVGY